MKKISTPPNKPGWYWFRPGLNSPSAMTRMLSVVVRVGIERDELGVEHLVVRFPRGTYYVHQMGGEWSENSIEGLDE